jgi:hypothetical protein
MSTTPDDPLDGAELPTPNIGDDAGVDHDGNEEQAGNGTTEEHGEHSDETR